MFKFKLANDLSIIGMFTCPECSRESEHNLSDKRDGDSISCPCGARVLLTGDGFLEARRELLEFQNFIKRGGK